MESIKSWENLESSLVVHTNPRQRNTREFFTLPDITSVRESKNSYELQIAIFPLNVCYFTKYIQIQRLISPKLSSLTNQYVDISCYDRSSVIILRYFNENENCYNIVKYYINI